jgi:protein involved in polysaccharide export with SLBB domain
MVNGVVTSVIGGALLFAISGNGIAGGPMQPTETSKIALATADAGLDRAKLFRELQAWVQNIPTAIDREKLFRDFQAWLQNIPATVDREKLFREFQARLNASEQLFREFQAWLKSSSPPVAPAAVPAAPAVVTRGTRGEMKVAMADPDHLFADFNALFRGPVPAAVAAPAAPTPAAVAPPPQPTPSEPARPAVQPNCDQVSPTGHFEIGDNIKLVFYEYDSEADKWGKKTGIGFEQSTELSGEYTVQEDGTIAVPLLGSFVVHNHSTKDLQSDLTAAFEKMLGRKGFVTVRSNERPPIYVLGPVKTPGSFKYSLGMTVFHAMALAGGFNQPTEPWQQVDAVREATRRTSALEEMSELLVREAVLKSERDQVEANLPHQLVALVGDSKAKALIAAEISRRLAIVSARQTRERTLAEQINMAKQDMQMLTSHMPSDELIRNLQERAKALQGLLQKGWASRVQVLQVQGQLSEAEQRRQDALARLTEAKQRLATLEQDKARLDADTRSELDTAINTIEQQIAGDRRSADGSGGVLGALKVGVSSEASKFSYQIVRQTANGPVEFAARGMTPLYPGDLVRIVTPEDGQNPATAPETVTPPGFKNASFACK